MTGYDSRIPNPAGEGAPSPFLPFLQRRDRMRRDHVNATTGLLHSMFKEEKDPQPRTRKTGEPIGPEL